MVQVGKEDNFFNHAFRRYVDDEHIAYEETRECNKIKELIVRLKMKQVSKCGVKFI